MTGFAPSHACARSVNGQGRGKAKRGGGGGEGDRDQSIDKGGGGGGRSRLKKIKTTGASHLFIFYRRLSFFKLDPLSDH